MKRSKHFLFLLLLVGSVLSAQVQNPNYYNHLYYACKVWGVIKYFHPTISAEPHPEWDDVIAQACIDLQDANSDSAFANILLAMCDSAGDVEHASAPPPEIADSLSYNLDLGWFQDPRLPDSVRARLDSVFVNFRPHDIYWVGEAFENGNPTFDNDARFYYWGGRQFPDPGKRFLALCRYWNIINYFYPYKYIMDQKWDSTLVEFIPKFIQAIDALEYNKAMLELASRLNDTHAGTYSAVINEDIIGLFYPPLVLDFVEGETVIARVLGDSMLAPGDVVKEIAGRNIDALRDSLRPYIAASTPAALEREVNKRLLRGIYGPMDMAIDRDGILKTITVERRIAISDYSKLLKEGAPKYYKIETDGREFGYVNMGALEVQDIASMFLEFWNCPAIIFDIRNYPNGTLWYMIRYLFDAPIHIASFTRPDIQYPGTLAWMDEIIGMGSFSTTYQGYVVLLFDKDTQSQAEYTCMGIEQHPNAIKIGSQTAGADGNVSRIYLPGGIITYFTGLGTFYPDHSPTQRVGIIPDYYVRPTIKGYRNGEDEVLQFALDHLKTLIPTSIAVHPALTPASFHLAQNYPNPFNPSTTIEYTLPQSAQVHLAVYNLRGQIVRTLIDEEQSTGAHAILWRGEDERGAQVSSGIYFYRLRVTDAATGEMLFSEERKMALMR